MSRTLWAVLGLLCAWGFITAMRRLRDEEERDTLHHGKHDIDHQPGTLKDSIDWDELERAEDEVRGLDAEAKPEDGFEGDDWGPGAGSSG